MLTHSHFDIATNENIADIVIVEWAQMDAKRDQRMKGAVMTRQPLKPTTRAALKETPVGHQFNNFVRIARADVELWLRDKRVLWIDPKGAAFWLAASDATKGGAYYVYWG